MGAYTSPFIRGKKRNKALAVIGLVGISLCATQAFSGDTSYRYDALGRVIQVRYPDNTQISYSYDAAGNRVAVSKTVLAPPTVSALSLSVPYGGSSTVTASPTGTYLA